MKNKSRGDLPLLNYEGDVLKLKKIDDNEYVIYDQWDSIVDVLSRKELFDALDGRRELTDSSGKTWNWIKEHQDARTPLAIIARYIC
jgi:hypothetical protein